ncbi:MAG: cobalamin-dependent protein [Nitrospirae bacterium]|nr:cobalamin-dependent protein [Nitrospirota bacterium]
MRTEIDIVLVNPGDRKQVFQNLDADFSAIEPPFWVAVIAAYLRNCGFGVAIIDANADNITPDEVAARVEGMAAMLSVVVVYGSQPSASTQNMTIAGRICKALKAGTSSKVAIGGLHPSALPERTFKETGVDFVIEGEGPYTLKGLIQRLKTGDSDYSNVPGLWYGHNDSVLHTPRAPLITDLDEMLPLAAWDLLPMKTYRAHNWHCFDDLSHRRPYGAIYTSLGCPFNCIFCCINAPFGKPGIRYRSPELIIDEIGDLVKNYGVKNIKIVDELFVFSEPHYMGIVELILQHGYDLNIWAYARVDTVKVENLKKMKKAGINWLALGIESANPDVRDGASKRMRVNDIKAVVGAIQDAGIRVIGNYIFGLPDDTLATMQETLDMAIDLKCEFTNIYCAMAYPGSKLYDIAVAEGWKLPQQWHGYSQHSYETLPLPTRHLKAEDVLRFRDDAFECCYSDPGYLDMVGGKFGAHVRKHIVDMNSIRLKRKLLGD